MMPLFREFRLHAISAGYRYHYAFERLLDYFLFVIFAESYALLSLREITYCRYCGYFDAIFHESSCYAAVFMFSLSFTLMNLTPRH